MIATINFITIDTDCTNYHKLFQFNQFILLNIYIICEKNLWKFVTRALANRRSKSM